MCIVRYVVRYVDIDKKTGRAENGGGVSTTEYERKGNAERAKHMFELENERWIRCVWVAEVRYTEHGREYVVREE